jgi:hypothetical protein
MVPNESNEMWSEVKEHFLASDEVQKQGESLKIRKKMFVMLNKGRFIVKLPKERVCQLLDSGEGEPYDPGNGNIMKEWIIIPEEFKSKWIEFANEGKKFVLTLAK